jgi:hypothetical protein
VAASIPAMTSLFFLRAVKKAIIRLVNQITTSAPMAMKRFNSAAKGA